MGRRAGTLRIRSSCIGCQCREQVKCSGWWAPTALASRRRSRFWRESSSPTWASSTHRPTGRRVHGRWRGVVGDGSWRASGHRGLTCGTPARRDAAHSARRSRCTRVWRGRAHCSPPTALRASRRRPLSARPLFPRQDVLNHFRGSELQNYFTKILEDNIKVTRPRA